MVDSAPEAQLLSALAHAPGFEGRRLAVEQMVAFGGAINRTMLLSDEVTAERFVVRLPGGGNAVLEGDAEREAAITRIAARTGAGPEVAAYLRPEGYLITRFIEGRRLTGSEIAEPLVLQRVATAMRLVHEGPPFPGRFDPVVAAQRYLQRALGLGVQIPNAFGAAHDRVLRIASHGGIGSSDPRPCHNDPFSNLIDDGTAVHIIDWEYAAMGDPFFDLGTISIKYRLTAEEDAAMLATYDQSAPSPQRLARITLMRVVSDYHEAAWHVAQHGLGHDTEQLDKARGHLDQLLRNSATREFERALTTVSSS